MDNFINYTFLRDEITFTVGVDSDDHVFVLTSTGGVYLYGESPGAMLPLTFEGAAQLVDNIISGLNAIHSATLYSGSGTNNQDSYPQFWE